jgi:predicted Zn-dependent peptidase
VRALLAGAVLLLGAASAGAQAPDRSAPPPLGPAPELRLPPIERTMLSNGLPVWLVASGEVPLVQVDLLVRAGAGDDPGGRYGVASLTAAMLDEGAGPYSALELADAVEFLGASLTTGSTFDGTSVRLSAPVARLAEALPLMADVALRPAFPDADLERLRAERLTALLQARDDPAALVAPAFARAVFGPDHRYGVAAEGTEGSLTALVRQDLLDFHAAYYRPSNAVLVIAGDTTLDEALPLLEDAFGAWPDPGPVARTPVPDAPQLDARRVTIVDVPGAAQSQVRIGWVGVARDTPDYFALEVLNTVLGGSFTSRLNQNLREAHGYTYGAGSAFQMRLAPGVFLAAAGVETSATAPALTEFFNEFRGMLDAVPNDELENAKRYLALGFPGEFETLRGMTGHLEELVVYGLRDDWFDAYVAQVEAVTAADVLRAAERHIQPLRFAVVIVGDRARIEDEVRALDLGPVDVMSVDEALGARP